MDEETYIHRYGKRDGTTSFMRSLSHLPGVINLFTEDPLRRRGSLLEIAIVGCSVGMEVYSYAFLCETYGFFPYRVDGYDIHEERLRAGEEGVYPIWWGTMPALDDERIKTGLARVDHGPHGEEVIRIEDTVKRNVRFLSHDISRAPLPQCYDVVVCTNVLGQEQAGGRREAVGNLFYSVREGGVLVHNYPASILSLLPEKELASRVDNAVQKHIGIHLY